MLASDKNSAQLDSRCISSCWMYNLWRLSYVHMKKILGWVLCIPGKTTAGFKYKKKCQFKYVRDLVYIFISPLACCLARYKPRAPSVSTESLWPESFSALFTEVIAELAPLGAPWAPRCLSHWWGEGSGTGGASIAAARCLRGLPHSHTSPSPAAESQGLPQGKRGWGKSQLYD